MCQRLYLWDLNQKKYVRVRNESLHQKYDYDRQCVYCVYDTRRRNGKEDILPRCDEDVSTRSRFLGHLQCLEKSLNRRLICFEEELPVFRLQDLLDKEKPPARASVDSSGGSGAASTNNSIVNNSNSSTSDPIDVFLQLIVNKNQNDNLYVATQTADLPETRRIKAPASDLSEGPSDSESPSAARYASDEQLDSSNSDTNSETNGNTSSEETSLISGKSDSLESVCAPAKSVPIIKSIKQIEYELNELSVNRKPKKLKTDHDSSVFDYVVRVNQITDSNEIKFLCYLDELN